MTPHKDRQKISSGKQMARRTAQGTEMRAVRCCTARLDCRLRSRSFPANAREQAGTTCLVLSSQFIVKYYVQHIQASRT